MMLFVTVPIGILIGAVLGLVGSGGALMSTPLLMISGHFSFQAASASALFVVVSSSALSLIVRKREFTPRNLIFKAIIWGMVGAPIGVWASHFVSNDIARVILVILLISAAVMTWDSKERPRASISGAAKPWLETVLFAFVGIMTGLTGIGGGYVLVPVLHLISGLKFKQAISASLFVVVANAAVAMVFRAINGLNLEADQWQATGILVAAALIGSVLGSMLSNRLNRQIVQKTFAIMLILLSATLVIQVALPFAA